MSLINDALKKAQRQREGSDTDPAGSLAPQSPQAVSASPVPAGKNNAVLIIAGAAVVVALSVAATVYLLRNGQRETSPPMVANGAVNLPTPPAGSTAPVTPPPVSPATKPASTAPGTTTPVVASNGSTNTAAASSPTVSPQTADATAQSSPTDASAAAGPPESVPRVSTPEAEHVKATNRIQGLIDKFKISGIRLADADSKVLLNDHLFRINDLVEPSLGLRITKIESHELTFTDADGNSYLKHF